MSALPAMKSSPALAGATFEMKNAAWSRPMWQASVALAVAAALTVAACTGGAGLDVPIGPVDHSCPVENSCGGHK